MYLILSNVDGNTTSSKVSEVFHDLVDVIGLRVAEEEKVRLRSSVEECPPEKVHQRRSTGEGPLKNVRWRRGAAGMRRVAIKFAGKVTSTRWVAGIENMAKP